MNLVLKKNHIRIIENNSSCVKIKILKIIDVLIKINFVFFTVP